MTKTKFLELLIKSYGLIPKDVKYYRTDGCDGQFEVGIGWEGHGEDADGNWVIKFAEPDGFNMAVKKILTQARHMDLPLFYIEDELDQIKQ